MLDHPGGRAGMDLPLLELRKALPAGAAQVLVQEDQVIGVGGERLLRGEGQLGVGCVPGQLTGGIGEGEQGRLRAGGVHRLAELDHQRRHWRNVAGVQSGRQVCAQARPAGSG